MKLSKFIRILQLHEKRLGLLSIQCTKKFGHLPSFDRKAMNQSLQDFQDGHTTTAQAALAYGHALGFNTIEIDNPLDAQCLGVPYLGTLPSLATSANSPSV